MSSSAAQRMRASRARRDAGRAVFRLELDEVDVAEMLVAGGLLSCSDTEHREKVTAALEQQIALLIKLSRQDRCA